MFLANRRNNGKDRGWLRCAAAVRNKHRCGNLASVPYAALERDIIDSIGGYALEASGLEQEVIKDTISEKIAANVAEMVKFDETAAHMSAKFTEEETKHPLLAKQFREMMERHTALTKETEDLRIKKSLEDSRPSTRQIVMQMLNDLHSPGSENVLEVRARMAQGLRQILEVVWCCPDRDVIVRLPIGYAVIVTSHCLKDGAYHRWHLDYEELTDDPPTKPHLPTAEQKMQDPFYRKLMGYEKFTEADLDDWLEETEVLRSIASSSHPSSLDEP